MEGELRRIQADIEHVKRAHKSELDKVNSEMGEVAQVQYLATLIF